MRIATITVGGQPLDVYVAENSYEWRQGLVGRDVDGLDGMLFVFTGNVTVPFQMAGMSRSVLLAVFAATGAFVDLTYLGLDAEPYTPAGSYRYALELVGHHTTQCRATHLLPELHAGLTLPIP